MVLMDDVMVLRGVLAELYEKVDELSAEVSTINSCLKGLEKRLESLEDDELSAEVSKINTCLKKDDIEKRHEEGW